MGIYWKFAILVWFLFQFLAFTQVTFILPFFNFNFKFYLFLFIDVGTHLKNITLLEDSAFGFYWSSCIEHRGIIMHLQSSPYS